MVYLSPQAQLLPKVISFYINYLTAHYFVFRPALFVDYNTKWLVKISGTTVMTICNKRMTIMTSENTETSKYTQN
jgi:hypothetical protein